MFDCERSWYVKLPLSFEVLNKVERKMQNNSILEIADNRVSFVFFSMARQPLGGLGRLIV
jgi:hypothetical protein